jgi:hypothetical protein
MSDSEGRLHKHLGLTNNVLGIIVSIIALFSVVGGGILFAQGHNGPSANTGKSTTPALASVAPTKLSATSTSTVTPAPVLASYTASQPGPGCDTNAGIWTAETITQITCGTSLFSPTNARGFLKLQLPRGLMLSSTFKISTSAINLNTNYQSCPGLFVASSTAGYLAEACSTGQWAIYSISNSLGVVATLNSGLSATTSHMNLALSLQSNTLTFNIDAATYTVSNAAIASPTLVGISCYEVNWNYSPVTVTSFAYLPLP